MIEVTPEVMSQLIADNVIEVENVYDEQKGGSNMENKNENSDDSDEFFDADHVHHIENNENKQI